MTDPQRAKTHNEEDLEAVDVRTRASRGIVVSVRLSSSEAQDVAAAAEKAGLSVSEFARRALRSAVSTPWSVRVWNGRRTAVVVGNPPETGGEYGHAEQDDEAVSPSVP
jgi:hypothetical protein